MIIIDSTSVSDDLHLVRFSCHPEKCLGVCCVEGDAGAPLEEEEISVLEDDLDHIKSFMTERGIKTVEEIGVFDYDAEGKFVTPLVNGAECAFANFSGKVAQCAIEQAFEKGKTSLRKPLSCHLYPVRITKYDSFDAVNYHKWHICKPALKRGNVNGIPLFRFLKEALVRKYGKDWYEGLEREIDLREEKGQN